VFGVLDAVSDVAVHVDDAARQRDVGGFVFGADEAVAGGEGGQDQEASWLRGQSCQMARW
jgi:hypothetical protein